MSYPWEISEDSTFLYIHLTPGAKRSELGVIRQGPFEKTYLRVYVNAPAVDNAANEALIRFMADKLNCTPSQISILKGMKDRYKLLKLQLSCDLEQLKRLIVQPQLPL